MDLGIVIPLIVLPLALIAGFVWYRRSIDRMRPDDAKPVSGVRLTAEALHRLESPPWRIVYEIGGALGGVDHVVIGPPGVIAITTIVADRPEPDRLTASAGAAQLVADAAIARGPVDELARHAGTSCEWSARVFWGVPDPKRPVSDAIAHGSHLVEGQRIADWLAELGEPDRGGVDAALTPSQVDLTWQAIVMGIGRPDPLG